MAFSIFMALILVAYFLLLRYELRQERKMKTGYKYMSEKTNSYSQKISFLENQEISATTF
jgi:hypothetical protein